MNEQSIQQNIRLALSKIGARIFRNNVAQAWTGSKVIRHTNGSVTILNARPIRAGLHKGSGDLIGWKTLKITQEMVGKKIAVFCSLEVKTAKGKASLEQLNWDKIVTESGGLSGIVKSVEEALKILTSIEVNE